MHTVFNSCQCLQAYAISAYQFDIKLCKTNRPPHSAVRAPGKFESPLIMEHIIEHVAARLNLDPVKVRELNFLKAPPSGACFTAWTWQHAGHHLLHTAFVVPDLPARHVCSDGLQQGQLMTALLRLTWCKERLSA